MKYVRDYFTNHYHSGIISLTVNTTERWMYFHRFSDTLYRIGGDPNMDTTAEGNLEIYKSEMLEIPEGELVFVKGESYLPTVIQEKDQISFYFTPFHLIRKEKPMKSTKPELVGHLKKRFGFNGYKKIEAGSPVYEFQDRYLFYMTPEKEGGLVIEKTFYKDSLRPEIEFLK